MCEYIISQTLSLQHSFSCYQRFFFFCRAVVGEMDEDLDSRLDLANIRAEPLASVTH